VCSSDLRFFARLLGLVELLDHGLLSGVNGLGLVRLGLLDLVVQVLLGLGGGLLVRFVGAFGQIGRASGRERVESVGWAVR